MCMEAALSLSSLVAVSSTSTSQVGLNTVSGVNSSSQVVPLASCEGGKSFAGLFKSPIIETLPVPSIPSKKGGYVSVRVDLIAYQARLELCRNALIGCVVLSSGERPWKVVDLKPWVPDFNPSLQKSINAQVWVRFFDLSWEYQHQKIISDLAKGIGVLLRLDKVTSDGDFGHYARVLVDIDVYSPDVGGHDSVVIHTSVGSNLISGSTSSAGLVFSSNSSSSTVLAISEVASSSVPPKIFQALQISKGSGFCEGVTDSVLVPGSWFLVPRLLILLLVLLVQL
ncbi:hypothetical protein LWI28_021289 [Acer negundo]|uniref:DUF4283 domain-containing protein n=1 Tax=Acer negundo TaxID=4023 RepID=A0AAD5JBH9_ACENE|nr:hypothetical protein LWI28_021289 [Acer negundo]